MARKTQEVLDLVEQALRMLPAPYGDDVIDQVADGIARTALAQYNGLCAKLTKDVVNQWIGRWTKVLVGRHSAGQFSTNNKIISSYSKLV